MSVFSSFQTAPMCPTRTTTICPTLLSHWSPHQRLPRPRFLPTLAVQLQIWTKLSVLLLSLFPNADTKLVKLLTLSHVVSGLQHHLVRISTLLGNRFVIHSYHLSSFRQKSGEGLAHYFLNAAKKCWQTKCRYSHAEPIRQVCEFVGLDLKRCPTASRKY